MDINMLRAAVTVMAFAAFVGVLWWAYRPAHKARFERDALLPFDDETDELTHGDKGQER
jgi:cytochrome c oxidase cbb3-type subunit 4